MNISAGARCWSTARTLRNALADYNEALRLTPGVLVGSELQPYVQHASALLVHTTGVLRRSLRQSLKVYCQVLSGLWLHLCSISSAME